MPDLIMNEQSATGVSDSAVDGEFEGESAISIEPRAERRGVWPFRLRGVTNLTAVWVLLGRVSSIAMNALMGIYLAHVLLPADYGHFAVLISIISVGSTITMFGMNEVVMRLVSQRLALCDMGGARRVIRLAVYFTLAASPVVLALTPFLLDWLGGKMPADRLTIGLVAIGAITLGWQRLACNCLQALDDQKWAHLLGSGQQAGGVSLFCFLVGLALLEVCAQVSLAGVLCLYVAFTVVTAVVGIGRTWLKTHRGAPAAPAYLGGAAGQPVALDAPAILKLAAPLFLVQLINIFTVQSIVWLAASCVAPDQVALLVASQRMVLLVSLPVQFAIISLVHVIPRLYICGELAELQRLLQRVATYSGAVSGAALLLLMLAGNKVMALCFGPSYAAAYAPLLILASGQLVCVLVGLCPQVLVSTGNHNVILTTETICTAVMVVVTPFLARQYGISAIAAVGSACAMIKSVVYVIFAKRRTGIWTVPTLSFR